MISRDRTDRHRIIAEAIASELIHSQADVVRTLRRHGIRVTQATASRDLDEIGAVRGKDSKGKISYQLPNKADIVLDERMIRISSNGSILVVKTRPGAAQLVASRIDAEKIDGILGTIAGDDTIFVALTKPVVGKRVSGAIGRLFNVNNGGSRGKSSKSKGRS